MTTRGLYHNDGQPCYLRDCENEHQWLEGDAEDTRNFKPLPKHGFIDPVRDPITQEPYPQLPVKWADAAMYRREPMPEETRATGGGRRPSVRLINATSDPLGTLAQLVGIYKGKVMRSLAEVSDDERREALAEMLKTQLNGPLESIQFQFLIEGVTRSFTHQAVRTRAAFFAQESLRFAVADNEDWIENCAYPPSLAAPPKPSVQELLNGRTPESGPSGFQGEWDSFSQEDQEYALKRDAWDDAIIVAQQAYQRLINAGIPAEDARGLIPHAMTTRYVWVVSFRTLLTDAGKRLCTQAQFEWRQVMAEVVQAIRSWATHTARLYYVDNFPMDANWQFNLMADLLKPVCYQEGKCGFMAAFDRGCSIRSRVDANARAGRPSSEWGTPALVNSYPNTYNGIAAIRPEEWLADPNAAR